MCAIEIEPVLETRRLRLRRPRRTDTPRVAELLGDLEVSRMTTSIPHPYGLADAEAWLAAASDADPDQCAEFIIEHPGESAIGVVSFDGEGPRRTEIGYWLGRPWWGRGFATEAARAALVWAHKDWGRRHVHARHFSDNPASAEILCKLGFLYTGEVRLTPSRARGGEAVPSRMMVWLA
jgi:RimJ/RimL family protein N-acetyltransferase